MVPERFEYGVMLPPGNYWERGTCDVCGVLPPPLVHHLCHDCGHPIDEHTPMTLTCRMCGAQCGVSTIYPDYGVEHGWWKAGERPDPAPADDLEQARLW